MSYHGSTELPYEANSQPHPNSRLSQQSPPTWTFADNTVTLGHDVHSLVNSDLPAFDASGQSITDHLTSLPFNFGNSTYLMDGASDISSSNAVRGTMTDVSSSFVMVSNRARSNGSNGTFGYRRTDSSDESRLTTPSESIGLPNEWFHGADFSVEHSRTSVDGIMYMPHSAELALVGLYSPELRPIIDPYQQVPSNIPEAAWPYSTQQNLQFRPFNDQKPPWNAYGQDFRVSSFLPGYPAFAPDPGPAAEQNQDATWKGIATLSQPQASCSASSKLPLTSAFFQENEKFNAGEAGWEHIVIRKNGLSVISEMSGEAQPVHKRKLSRQGVAKAARIRKIRACWPCWLMKVSCSENDPCTRCIANLAQISSPTADQLCSRQGFKDFEVAFFPEYLHSHFQQKEIEGLINEHARHWTNTCAIVDVTIGEFFTTLELQVNVFVPRGNGLMFQHHLTTQAEEEHVQLMQRSSAPVGLLCLTLSDLKHHCRQYIEAMIDNPLYAKEATLNDPSSVPCMILQIVQRYFGGGKDAQLVRDTYMLHAIQYFMSRLITFVPSSAQMLYQAIPSLSTLGYQPYLSSRLLNRQIKYAMHKLHRDLTVNVLESLEKSMRSRSRDSWGPSFATILILCLCIEGLQTAADTFIVCDAERCHAEGEQPMLSRNMSQSACTALEEFPFEMCVRLFHDIYRSKREQSGPGRDVGGFNPLRDGTSRKDFGDGKTVEMVNEVAEVVKSHMVELYNLSHHPPMIDFRTRVDVSAIRKNNAGRLVAKFLLSFY